MTPPISRSADAGTPPIDAATTDASVPADASVSADAGAPVAADASVPADAGASAPNPLRLRIGLEGGPAWLDMSNGPVLDHFGGYVRAEAGAEYRINDTFFAQVGGVGSFGWLSRDLGMGVNSTLNYQSILAHGRLGAQFLNGNLRFTGGIELGATHVGSPECADGMSCGALFSRNAQLLPIDSWTFSFGADIGVSTLQGALGIYLRYNNFPGVNPAFNVVDGDPLHFGLNPSMVQIGFAVDPVAIYNLFAGNGHRAPQPPASSDTPHPVDPAHPAGGTEPVAPVAPTGLALVQARHDALAESRRRATSSAESVTSARGLYQAITGRGEDEMRNRRLYASEVATQAQAAVEYYQQFTQAIADARTAMNSLSGADRTTAEGLLREMTTWQTETRGRVSTAVRQANEVADHFNGLPNHGDGVYVTVEDPIPGRTRPGRGRGTHRDPHPPADPHPPVVHPPADPHPPVVHPPADPIPPVVHPPADPHPPVSHPDAGAPPMGFDPRIIEPAPHHPPASHPDAGVPHPPSSSGDENG